MTASSEQRAVSSKDTGATHERNVIGIMRSSLLHALCSVGVLLFALSFPAQAQQLKKVPRIGLLMSSSTTETAPFIEAFRQGMRELGYVEGKNFVLEIRGVGRNPIDFPIWQMS